MNLQIEAIHLEQKSKKKGHSASAWYLPWGMCVCLCAHPVREVLMYKSSLKRKKQGKDSVCTFGPFTDFFVF